MFAREIQIVNDFLKRDKDAFFYAETKAVGGNEWSLEVYGVTTDSMDSSSEFLFELVGSNGTDETIADDLWASYYKILELSNVPA